MVYQVIIPNFLLLNQDTQSDLRPIADIVEWRAGRAEIPGVYMSAAAYDMISAPMNRTQLDKVVEVLDRVQVGWTSHDISSQYAFVLTTAPESYDYGYVVPLTTSESGERGVAIPVSHKDYQMARYSSGLHPSRVVP